MIGVVLCGGRSSRMGTDKGLLTEGNKTWSQIAKEKLSSLSLTSVVSINPLQRDRYASYFSENELIEDKVLSVKGPMLGLLSVHEQFVNEDLFILGCDLPKMELCVFQSLMTEYTRFPQFDSYVFINGDYIEPLCGIYTSNGLNTILTAVNEGRLNSHRMKDALDLLKTKYLPLKEEWKTFFQNINSPTDLTTY